MKQHSIRTLALSASLLYAVVLSAQHVHVTPPDGQPVTDELSATEQVLIAACDRPNYNKTELAGRAAFRESRGMGKFASEFNQFCARFDALVDKYNRDVAKYLKDPVAAQNIQDDFLITKRGMVQEELANLRRINADDADLFKVLVTAEMAHMSFSPELDGHGVPVTVSSNYIRKAKLRNVSGSYTQTGYTSYVTQGVSNITSMPGDGTVAGNLYQTLQISGTYSAVQCQWDSYHGQWQPPGCPATHTPIVNNVLTQYDPNDQYAMGDYGGVTSGGGQYYLNYLSISSTIAAPFTAGSIWKDIKIWTQIACNIAKGAIVWWSGDYWQASMAYSKTAWTSQMSIIGGNNYCGLRNTCTNTGAVALQMSSVEVFQDPCQAAYACVAICPIVPYGGSEVRNCPGSPSTVGTRKNAGDPWLTVACSPYRFFTPSLGLIPVGPEKCTDWLVK